MLREFDWKCVDSLRIEDHTGVIWHTKKAEDISQIVRAIQDRSEDVELERAALHHLASGMALGADFGPAKAVLRQLRASKEHEAAGMAEAIVSGGAWLPFRKGVRPGLCRACGRKEETESHIFF